MKKSKLMLSAIAVLAIVGSALQLAQKMQVQFCNLAHVSTLVFKQQIDGQTPVTAPSELP